MVVAGHWRPGACRLAAGTAKPPPPVEAAKAGCLKPRAALYLCVMAYWGASFLTLELLSAVCSPPSATAAAHRLFLAASASCALTVFWYFL